MEDWTTGQRWGEGVRLAALVGVVAGLLEVFAAASGSAMPLGRDLVALAALAAGVQGALGAGIGLLAGGVHSMRPGSAGYPNVATQVGLTAGALAALHLTPPALARLDGIGGPVLLAMIPLAWFFTSLQLRYWLGRIERGLHGPGFVRRGLLALVAAVLALAVGADLARHRGGASAAARPSVTLVTVDALATDALDRVPTLAAWPAGRFTQAVSPTWASLAGHATMLTGLHPLRHYAVDEVHPLRAGVPGVAWRLREAGWATGAFVSSAVVGAHTGLADGFVRYDDRFGLPLARVPLTRRVVEVAWPAPVRRSGVETVAAWRTWRAATAGPVFSWVHLAEDDPAALDAALADLLPALADDVVVLTAPRGRGGPPSLAEVVVRVPLLLRAPGAPAASVDAQVRLMDVAPTLLQAAGLDPVQTSEGVELLSYLDGRRSKSLGAVLLGQNADGGPVLGVRQPDLKVLWDVRTDADTVYDLEVDPGETRDIASEQAAARASARGMLEPDAAALPTVWGRATFGEADVAAAARAAGR